MIKIAMLFKCVYARAQIRRGKMKLFFGEGEREQERIRIAQ